MSIKDNLLLSTSTGTTIIDGFSIEIYETRADCEAEKRISFIRASPLLLSVKNSMKQFLPSLHSFSTRENSLSIIAWVSLLGSRLTTLA